MSRAYFVVLTLSLPLLAHAPRAAQAQASNRQQLLAVAEGLMQQGRVRMTGDIECEVGPGDGTRSPAYTGSDSLALIRVASPERVYLFAHGFFPNSRQTRPPMDHVRQTWRGHLNLLRSLRRPYAACLFASDTAAGFGPNQPTIGDFLFALRALTDDADNYSPSRRITLVGYSAGVNYVKQALLTYQENLRSNGIGAVGIRPTPMDVVFFAGVHQGTRTAPLASAAVVLAGAIGRLGEAEPRTIEERWQQEFRERRRAENEALLTSRGLRQLEPGSNELFRINRAFLAALTPNVRVTNVASLADAIAPPEASSLPTVATVAVEGLTHDDFVADSIAEPFRSEIRRLYAR